MSTHQLSLAPPLYMLVQRSVALLLVHAPKDGAPYYGCFSGGKDSVVIKELARLAHVPVEWHYNVIIDPPELMKFIKQCHPDVKWNRSHHGYFFARMKEKLFAPTRFRRWCCREYKEAKGPKKCTRILGVRTAESAARNKRYTACAMPQTAGRKEIYPVRLWSDENVWQFIRERSIPYCALYDEGFTRLGCVGCPKASTKQRLAEFARWPIYERKWREALSYIYAERKRLGKPEFPPDVGPDGLFDWWIKN